MEQLDDLPLAEGDSQKKPKSRIKDDYFMEKKANRFPYVEFRLLLLVNMDMSVIDAKIIMHKFKVEPQLVNQKTVVRFRAQYYTQKLGHKPITSFVHKGSVVPRLASIHQICTKEE